MSHTPGPWEFDGRHQITEVADPDMRVAFLPSDTPEESPNGYLIAAAPEMLALLKLALGDTEYILSKGFWDEVRAAIAKAEGRKP